MGAYIIRKLLYGIAVLWGVATLVFFLFNILPGDPAQVPPALHRGDAPHAHVLLHGPRLPGKVSNFADPPRGDGSAFHKGTLR